LRKEANDAQPEKKKKGGKHDMEKNDEERKTPATAR